MTVEEYLAGLPDDKRAALQALRAEISTIIPHAEEVISYGVPTFRLRIGIVAYGATKSFCSLYVMSPTLVESMAEDLAGLRVSGATLHFQPDSPLPPDVVRKIVLARVEETGSTV